MSVGQCLFHGPLQPIIVKLMICIKGMDNRKQGDSLSSALGVFVIQIAPYIVSYDVLLVLSEPPQVRDYES